MAIGYLSLFYDDAKENLPNIILSESKKSIFDNYKKLFYKPNSEEKEDIRAFTQNKLLKDMSQLMQFQSAEIKNQDLGIPYWEINMAQAEAKIREASTEVEKINKVLEYLERVQTVLSIGIEKGQGKISSDIIKQLESNKESIARIAKNFGEAVDATSFKSVFYSTVRGGIWRAQGAIHECAGALAGFMAQTSINKELSKANKTIRVAVEQTGGFLREDSRLKAEAEKGKITLGRANNAKNDLTIVMYDEKTGQIIWNQGLSLKSTSAKEPITVHIATVSVGSLLNKVYDQQSYLNLAGSLGVGDWNGSRYGIGQLAEKQNISTSGTFLTQQWKEAVLNALYSQLIDIFSGGGAGVLNNAQYILINANPISMYEIFSKLESVINERRVDSIQGLQFTGKNKAMSRTPFVQENIKAFKRWDEAPTAAEARILRSTEAWQSINTLLQNTKISIKLNYKQLGLKSL